ncbi:MAG: PQQ-binding-like beta-propeller repeat protein [Verrucomicrobiae bacterium]|nr:PQQ-binding-like beta-propeller repeat protein [Verrucomicrobiae bacterium]
MAFHPTPTLKPIPNPPDPSPSVRAVFAVLMMLMLCLPAPPAQAAGAPGTLRWQVPLRGPVATPAIGPDGTIYAGGAEELVAIAPETGAVKWRVPASPTISIVLGPDGEIFHLNQTAVSSIGPASGDTLWSVPTATPERNSRIALTSNGNLLIVYLGIQKRVYSDCDWGVCSSVLQSLEFTDIDSTNGRQLSAFELFTGTIITANWWAEPSGVWGAYELVIDANWRPTIGYNWYNFNGSFSFFGWPDSNIYDDSVRLLGAVSALGNYGALYGARVEDPWNGSGHYFFQLGPQLIESDVDMSRHPDGEVPVVGQGVVYYAGKGSIYSIDSHDLRKHWNSSLDAQGKKLALGDDHILYVSGNSHHLNFGELGRISALSAATGFKRWEYRHTASVTSAPMISGSGILLVGADDGLLGLNVSSRGPASSPWPLERQNVRNTANQGDGNFPPSCKVTSPEPIHYLGEDLYLQGNPYGPASKSYQWYLNGNALAGQTNETLFASQIGPSLRGDYRFEVVSEFGRASDSTRVRIVERKTPLVSVGGWDVFEDGEFRPGSLVRFESGFPGGRVFFTLDGSTPRLDSPEFLEPFPLTSNLVVRALGVSADRSESGILGPLAIRAGDFPIPDLFGIVTEVDSGGSVLLRPDRREFIAGAEVSAAAIPNSGWRFLHWEGDLVGTEETGVVTMDSNKRVRAVFEKIPTPHSIRTSSVGAGGVYVAPREQGYQDGEMVIARAVPAPRWRFAGWAGDLGGTAPSAALLMDSSKSVIATFESIPEHSVTVASGGGVVSGDGVYLEGETATLTATALPGWTFLGWSGDHSGSEPTIVISVTRPVSLVARFGTRVMVNSMGSGEVVLEPPGEFHAHGSRVKVIPKPQPGNYLGLWDPQWSSQSKLGWVLTVTDPNPSITGIFVPLESDRDSLLVDTVGGGSVEANPPRMAFEITESVQLDARPWPGWTFAGWSGDVEGASTPATLAMTGPRRVTATFTLTAPGPTLAPIADQTIPELSQLAIVLEPGHPEAPVGGLGLMLVEAPPGMSVGAGRVLRWTPSEAQGPGIYQVRIRVVDPADLTAEEAFQVTVTEVNSPPGISILRSEDWSGDDIYLGANQTLSAQAHYSDPDLPRQSLVLDVVEGPPGLTVSPSGLVEWVPSSGHPRLTNEVVIRVTDDGEPPLSATTAFRVILLNSGAPPSIDGWTPLAAFERFEMVHGTFTWEEARADAASRGGHLATFASAAEWAAGRSVWQSYGRATWIGGYQREDGAEPRGGWEWITGEPWAFEAWAPSEPNNYLGFAENHLDILAAGGWNDAPGTTGQAYLLEHPDRGPVSPFDRFEVNEGSTLGVAIRVSDPDLPQQTLTLELLSAPEGMVLTPTRALIWTPTEAQGPSTNVVVLQVRDDGEPPGAATVSFEVVVREVNRAPAVASRWVMDFGTDPAAMATVAGTNNAAWVVAGGNPGGFLGLTYSRTNEYTAVVLPPVPEAGAVIAGFRMSCDLRTGNGTREQVADGFSFSFAREGDPVLVDPWDQTGYAGECCAETGTRTGVAVSFDTWAGNTFPGAEGDRTDVEGLIVRVDNVTVAKVALPTRNGEPGDATSLQTGPRDAAYWAGGGNPLWPAAWATLSWQPFVVELRPEGRLSVWWKGVAVLEGVETGFVPGPGRFVLAGRTANSVGNVHVDNLRLNVISRHEVAEGETLELVLNATDPDLPPQVLEHEVLAGPAGLTVSAGGVLSWTPSEAQGPSTNVVEVRVGDDGLPPLSVVVGYQIVVREVNQPPVIAPGTSVEVDEGSVVRLTLEASDPDLPPQALVFSLVSGPEGMTVTPAGELHWATSEADGPSTVIAHVRVTDDGEPPLSAANRIVITVLEVNEPPVIAPVADRVVDEGTLLSLQLEASDPDLPAQTLRFLLSSGPAGMTVSPTGELAWTPGEADGPGEFEVEVAVRDGGTPPLTAFHRFRITVREVNQPPVIAPGTSVEVDEGSVVRLTLEATDPDLPPQALVFSLVSGPEGMTVTPAGELLWATSEADGPSTVTALVRVTDNGEPPLSATNRNVITVLEVNEPPVIAPVADQVVDEGTLLSLQLEASDPDLPAQTLRFLLSSGPAGMTVSPTGELAWTPGEADGPGEFEVEVAVRDGGTPPLTAFHRFRITVREVNEPPVLDPVADQVASAGVLFELQLTGSDPDQPEQPLTFALVSGPAGMTVGADGLLSWTPPPAAASSTNEVTVALLDGALSVRGAFRIVVVENIQLQIEPPRADGRMVLKIRAPLLKPIVVEQATVLGDWTEFQRLLGLGMESPIELLLSPGAGSEPSFWHVRGE